MFQEKPYFTVRVVYIRAQHRIGSPVLKASVVAIEGIIRRVLGVCESVRWLSKESLSAFTLALDKYTKIRQRSHGVILPRDSKPGRRHELTPCGAF